MNVAQRHKEYRLPEQMGEYVYLFSTVGLKSLCIELEKSMSTYSGENCALLPVLNYQGFGDYQPLYSFPPQPLQIATAGLQRYILAPHEQVPSWSMSENPILYCGSTS